MTTEQKAKAYDEAIKKAESLYKVSEPMSGCNVIIETLFPELKESEDKDERIRKEILEYFQQFENDELRGVNISDWIAWLEKQANHANFRNKIQIGDKVTRNRDGYLVNLSQLNRVAKPAAEVEPKFHEGDIIKPKDGGHEPWQIMQVDIFDKKYRFKDGYVVHFSQEDAYELVEQKPTDEEIKELLRTEYEKGRADALAEMQKPAKWSDEDEKIINGITSYLCTHDSCELDGFDKWYDFLKSLKDRIQPQQEKERILEKLEEWLDEYISNLADVGTDTLIGSFRKYLDGKLPVKPRNRWKPTEEQMVAIDTAINVLGKGTLNGKQLIALKEQLKAL